MTDNDRPNAAGAERVEVEDLVRVATAAGDLFARVSARQEDALVVSPLTALTRQEAVPARDVLDCWRRAPRLPVVRQEERLLDPPPDPSTAVAPAMLAPVDTELIAAGDIVFVADVGAFYGIVRGRLPFRLAVSPLGKPTVVLKIPRSVITDHWQHLEPPRDPLRGELPIDTRSPG
ncbi:MAG TPA: hypothetical protein VGM91_19275 [Conexibacter sp.]|jgi:hypothetical protein